MNIDTLRILANSDQDVFAETITSFGMKVIGTKSDDPLEKRVEMESVEAMASIITEDVNDNADMTPAQISIQEIANEVGLIISLCEGT